MTPDEDLLPPPAEARERWRVWWSTASETDQETVLAHCQLNIGYAGLLWSALPLEVRNTIARRLRFVTPR